MPTTVFRKYAYADDLAIMHADRDWQAAEWVLCRDMATVGEYRQTWKLKLSAKKRCRLYSTSTTRKPNVCLKSTTTTESCPSAVKPNISVQRWTGHSRIADISSHFANVDITRRTLEATCWLCSGWVAETTTLRTTTLALVH